jgi:hypothetical protein
VTNQVRNSYKDLPEATEWGPCGIANALLERLAGMVVLERSVKGSGFDYRIGKPGLSKSELFQGKVRIGRVTNVEKLLYRVAERVTGKSYRERGQTPKD